MKYTCFLLCLCCCKFSRSQITNDTTAIKRLLEKESQTWRSGDVKTHATCWQIRPYSRILVSLADGRCFDVPPQNMLTPDPGQMDRGGTSINFNYRFHVHGNEAWVSHDEVSTAPNGGKNYSYEIRMLEKVKGAWKLVGQSVHIYNPATK